MLQVPVFDISGERTGAMEIDPQVLGGRVRVQLLKQAAVRHLANRRQGSAATKNRSKVAGSTRKLYKQKGTGNARAGMIRTPVRKGGGRAFPNGNENFTQSLPKKMRRLARNNAILAKITSDNVVIIDGLQFETPKTKRLAQVLAAVGVDKGCLLTLAGPEANVMLSGRNLPRTEVRNVTQLTSYEILRRPKLVFSVPAFQALQRDPVTLRPDGGAE